MPFLHDDVLDKGLEVLADHGNRLDICTQEPATFAEATGTYSIGNRTSLDIGAPEDRTPDGRKVTVAEIDGTGLATDTGTPTHWAITDTTGERLLATGELTNTQEVILGNPFSLTAFDIGIPDAVSE